MTTRRRRILFALASLLSTFLALGVYGIFYSSERTGLLNDIASARELPQALGELPFAGAVNYTIQHSYRGSTYWFAGRARAEDMDRFCQRQGIQLRTVHGWSKENEMRYLAAQRLDPANFSLRCSNAYQMGIGTVQGMGSLSISYVPEQERLIVQVKR